MRVAVTGANGFIGRHVTAELARRGIDMTLVSRSSASPASQARPRTSYTQIDIAAPPPDAFDRMERPDVLIHLAWGGLPNYKSMHHCDNELPAQTRFLERLIRSGLTHLVVSGTCFEYGMQSGPLTETMDAHPANPYAQAKDSLRRRLETLQATHPFEMTWARLFYMYGEGQAETSLWTKLNAAIKRGDKTFDMSGGEQIRDFLPVTDVARCLVDLALQPLGWDIVNVCSGRPISVRQLVEGWALEHSWPIEFRFGKYPYPDYEPMEFWGDRTKLDRILSRG